MTTVSDGLRLTTYAVCREECLPECEAYKGIQECCPGQCPAICIEKAKWGECPAECKEPSNHVADQTRI